MAKTRVKVETCGHLELELKEERGIPIIFVDLDKPDTNETNVGKFYKLHEEDAKCTITKETCALMRVEGSGGCFNVDFDNIRRCPMYFSATKSYDVEGYHSGSSISRVTSIKRAE